MKDKYTGCLLGLGVGDALGAAVEFLSLERIKDTYGDSGIEDFDQWDGFEAGSYTDDTQMAVATARGLIRFAEKRDRKDVREPALLIYREYLKWLETQDDPPQVRRPGKTCLSALRSGKKGTLKKPINDSKGCGGVMRVAPVGLAFSGANAFYIGAKTAALTHGNASGYLSAGFLAELIGYLIESRNLRESIKRVRKTLFLYTGHEETLEKVDLALRLAEDRESIEEGIKTLGEGWLGEEALAVSLFCSLMYEDDFSGGIKAAVNHSGDSDSTGAVTGAVLGAKLGVMAIPENWLEKLENREMIRKLSQEIYQVFSESKN
ncbi:MAG: hypothetical protein GF421_10695 [Candidatus Aminicenantes bacterium]|nr:hypothetical protein [Candidatus Aminicenantes bacterium]